jgi:hypothetical protein
MISRSMPALFFALVVRVQEAGQIHRLPVTFSLDEIGFYLLTA